MHRFIRPPSPPLVVACLALFISLSGTSLADIAQVIPRGSVGTPQLKNGAVTSAKIRNNAVTLAKLARNARIRGPQGPSGPTGPQGPQGPPGAPVNLADGAISTAKLANNAVTSAKVADGAISLAKLADNAVTAAKLANGAVTSAKLTTGAVTAGKLATTPRYNEVSVASGIHGPVIATCNAGEKVVGGGGGWGGLIPNTAASKMHMIRSYPGPAEWRVSGYNNSGATRTLFAYAICVNAG